MGQSLLKLCNNLIKVSKDLKVFKVVKVIIDKCKHHI